MDEKFIALFGQTAYLAQELRGVQGELKPENFGQKIQLVLRESGLVSDTVKQKVLEETLRLSEMMKLWIHEEVEKLSPNLEKSVIDKFSVLEHGLRAQTEKIFQLIQHQQEALQKQNFEQGVRAASVQASPPSPAIAEMQSQVEEVQRRLHLVQRLEVQTQVLLQMMRGLEQGLSEVKQRGFPLAEVQREIETRLVKYQLDLAKKNDPGLGLSQHQIDLVEQKMMEKFTGIEKRMTQLERENTDLRIKLATMEGPSELLKEFVISQAHPNQHMPMPTFHQIPGSDPPHAAFPDLTEKRGSIESENFQAAEKPDLADMRDPLRTKPQNRKPRIMQLEGLHPKAEFLGHPFIFPEEEEDDETTWVPRGSRGGGGSLHLWR